MESRHFRRAVAAGALLALPASAVAQEAPPGMVSPPAGVVLMPDGTPAPPLPTICPPPERPGLFGWRRRHAERKRHYQEAFIGYPEEFEEAPLGRSLYANGRTMVANAEAARSILNQYDFIGETAELNYRGRDKLGAIAAGLPSNFAPVIIERTPYAPAVAEARRLAILEKLAQGPFPVPPERVVVGPAIAQGLRGTEAILVDAYRAGLFYSGGGGGVGGGGGLDGAGLGPIGAAVGAGAGGVGR